jgi:hypothetical protein
MFLGDDAGQILGETVGGWVNDLRAADLPGKIIAAWDAATIFVRDAWTVVKVVALGTWDWVKSGWDSVTDSVRQGWDTAMAGLSAAGEFIGKTWSGFVETAKTGWDSVTHTFATAYEGLKSLPGIGTAIRLAEEGSRKLSEAAGAMKDKAVELGGKATDAVKTKASETWEKTKDAAGRAAEAAKNAAGEIREKARDTAGRALEGAKDFVSSLVPQGLKNNIVARRAMETGADYKQGNIAGLDEAHTRALVASTAATESAGGKLDVVNSAGYMGRYQAGAGWLADAGLIKGGSAAVRAAMGA